MEFDEGGYGVNHGCPLLTAEPACDPPRPRSGPIRVFTAHIAGMESRFFLCAVDARCRWAAGCHAGADVPGSFG